MDLQIRLATGYDLKKIYEHNERHFHESGVGENLIFAPTETPIDKSLDEFADEKFSAFEKTVKDVGWRRTWILTDGHTVFGTVSLEHSPRLKSSLHRCLLMMGLEQKYRGRGYGTKLMKTAIDWARTEKLDWIQLFVFSHNAPARSLYEKCGFQVVGKTPDLFRVRGQKIDDVEMVLELAAQNETVLKK